LLLYFNNQKLYNVAESSKTRFDKS